MYQMVRVLSRNLLEKKMGTFNMFILIIDSHITNFSMLFIDNIIYNKCFTKH